METMPGIKSTCLDFFGKLLPKEKREQAENYVSVFYLEFLEVGYHIS